MDKRERHAANMREWRARNLEKARAHGRASYRRHAEKRKAEAKKWQSRNRARIRAQRAAKMADPEFRERTRLYMLEYQRAMRARRRAARPPRKTTSREEGRLKTALRTRIYKALHGIAKSQKTLKLLGCSHEQFRAYMEAQFLPGMTWGNHAHDGWHLDHIRPCASFDLTQPEEQAACFHYSNLRPLWAHDNMVKHARWAA